MAAKPVDRDELKTGGVAADRLRSIVDRIERLEEERKALGADIKDIYSEAKSAGFDVKALRQLIRIRKQEAAEVERTVVERVREATVVLRLRAAAGAPGQQHRPDRGAAVQATADRGHGDHSQPLLRILVGGDPNRRQQRRTE